MLKLCGDWKQVSKCENNEICGGFLCFFFTNIECSYERLISFALAMKIRRLIL